MIATERQRTAAQAVTHINRGIGIDASEDEIQHSEKGRHGA